MTSEYVLDEETNEMKLVKKKVNEKALPPNVDLLKMLFQQQDIVDEYEEMSDEELEQEKQRLLNELKEKNDDSRKGKSKGKV